MIELTAEQAHALESEDLDAPRVVNPITGERFALVREDVYERIERLGSEGLPWTAEEMAILAGAAFNKLDNADYSHYLRGSQ